MIRRHEYAKAVTCALTFCCSLAHPFPLFMLSFIDGVFLAAVLFQVRVPHWSLWFPHVRGGLRAPDCLTWRRNAWQVLRHLRVRQRYVPLSLAPQEEGFLSLWGMLGIWYFLLCCQGLRELYFLNFIQ